jgi:TetR/AcrR family transcriptional regulator, mexJK operon transcriptional repressor
MSGLMRKAGYKTEQAARLAALVSAAETVFLQKGYHAATMNDVAKAAGISKKTIYELVDSKMELFFSILADHHEKITFPPPKPGWTLADTLTANLLALGRFLLEPAQIALIRLIMAEYTHSPDFGRLFMRSRLVKAKARLEDALASLAREQGVPAAEAKEGSAMLFGMALGEFHIGTLIGFRPPPSRQALETRIRRAVEIFLAGVCPVGGPPSSTPPSKTCGGPPPGV